MPKQSQLDSSQESEEKGSRCRDREGARLGVEFVFADLRDRYAESRARELGLYVQKYCGCVFSALERAERGRGGRGGRRWRRGIRDLSTDSSDPGPRVADQLCPSR